VVVALAKVDKVDKVATQVHHQVHQAQAHQAQAHLAQVAQAAVAHPKKLNSVTREMEAAMVEMAVKVAGHTHQDHGEAPTVKN